MCGSVLHTFLRNQVMMTTKALPIEKDELPKAAGKISTIAL